MSPPRVIREVPGTNDFQQIGFSDPNLFSLVASSEGFFLLVHVATELGPISVEFRLLDRLATNCVNRLE